MAAPTIDGTPAHKSVSGVSSTTITLTTSLTNDIIVLDSYQENNVAGPLRTISSITGGGLSWQVRKSLPNQTNHQAALERWWALAPAALSAVTFTVNLTGATDDWSLGIYGVNGCTIGAPWDTNAGLPGTLAFNGQTATYSISNISTSQPNDLLLMSIGGVSNTDLSLETPPTGFSFLTGDHTNGGALDSCLGVFDKAVTATQTNITVAITLVGNLSDGTMMVDALTAGGGSGPGVAGNWRRIGVPLPWQMGI